MFLEPFSIKASLRLLDLGRPHDQWPPHDARAGPQYVISSPSEGFPEKATGK